MNWLLTAVAPLVPKLLASLGERLWRSWRSSVVGTGVAATSYELVAKFLEGAGCNPDAINVAAGIAAAAPLAMGLLAKDETVVRQKVISTSVAEEVPPSGH